MSIYLGLNYNLLQTCSRRFIVTGKAERSILFPSKPIDGIRRYQFLGWYIAHHLLSALIIHGFYLGKQDWKQNSPFRPIL